MVGFQKTHSANSLITDSAASGTAMACGIKTENGTIGIDTTKFETFFKENPEQFAALTSTRATTDNDAITSRISSFNLNDFVAGAYQFNLSGGTKSSNVSLLLLV